jgi:hypothetical protein
MMNYKKRASRLGAIAGLGLFAATSAHAYTMQVGGWDIQIDTTASVGVSMLTTDTDKRFLPTANGGPAEVASFYDPVAGGVGICGNDGNGPSAAQIAYGTYCITNSKANFDGAINTDDGRLNFNSSGDLVSAPFKITSDFEAKMGMTTAFMRVNAYYDAVLMDDSSFKRDGVEGGLTDRGEDNTGFDIQLLDAYVSWDFDVADRPMMVRVGKQVINWGEATFIPGGNSAFSPIDVAAIRRPGAEIKEALLPVEAVYASIALTDSVSVEAYVGGWDEYKLDVGGTAFAGSDAFVQGTKGGNEDVYFVGGGAYGSHNRFAGCGDYATDFEAVFGDQEGVLPALAAGNINRAVQQAYLAADAVNCDTAIDTLEKITSNSEARRRLDATVDNKFIKNDDDIEGNDSIGLAVRWYAEDLNSTEFGFYYQRMDSRLPYVSYKTGGDHRLTYDSVSPTTSDVGRGHAAAGCGAWTQGAYPMPGGALAPLAGGPALANPDHKDTPIQDPNGLLDDLNTVANAVANLAGLSALRKYEGDGTVSEYQEIVCLLQLGQVAGGAGVGYGGAASANNGAGNLATGTILPTLTWDMSLFAEFPEVTTYGFSFNTTVLGWGLQGDFTYRPDVPLQIDTDVMTIAALVNTCAFAGVAGVEYFYRAVSTYHQEFGLGCTEQSYLKGYVDDHDAITWDIGTTATFTASNPVVSALGANIGILLTEFQGLIVDGIEEDRAATYTSGKAPLVNTCTSGSDLVLNGALAIDDRGATGAKNGQNQPTGYCRPTDESAGMVLLGRLQYDNIFGTPIAVAPTIVVSHGLQGMSPSPIGQWRQGVGSAAVSLDFTYLSKWQAGISYRTYYGDAVRTKNTDRDHVSLSLSYAF